MVKKALGNHGIKSGKTYGKFQDSHSIGILVDDENLDEAISILEKELDLHVPDEHIRPYHLTGKGVGNRILSLFNPLFNPFSFSIGLLVIVLIVDQLYPSNTPGTLLIKTHWRVDSVLIDNQCKYFSYDDSAGSRWEILFKENGEAELPGYNTFTVKGKWVIDGQYIVVSGVTSFSEYYNTRFKLNFSADRRSFEMTSNCLKIACSSMDPAWRPRRGPTR